MVLATGAAWPRPFWPFLVLLKAVARGRFFRVFCAACLLATSDQSFPTGNSGNAGCLLASGLSQVSDTASPSDHCTGHISSKASQLRKADVATESHYLAFFVLLAWAFLFAYPFESRQGDQKETGNATPRSLDTAETAL